MDGGYSGKHLRYNIDVDVSSLYLHGIPNEGFISEIDGNLSFQQLLKKWVKDSTKTSILESTFEIKKVIFHDPATIVYWKDGTKTVVKCQYDELSDIEKMIDFFLPVKVDVYDPVKGLALCYMKKACGNKGSYNNMLHKWIEGEQE